MWEQGQEAWRLGQGCTAREPREGHKSDPVFLGAECADHALCLQTLYRGLGAPALGCRSKPAASRSSSQTRGNFPSSQWRAQMLTSPRPPVTGTPMPPVSGPSGPGQPGLLGALCPPSPLPAGSPSLDRQMSGLCSGPTRVPDSSWAGMATDPRVSGGPEPPGRWGWDSGMGGII